MSHSKYERELLNRLWNEGWAAFRVAGSGTTSWPSADIVAYKDGKMRVFEVKSYKHENLPLRLGDKDQLSELADRGMAGVVYALREKGDKSTWRVANYDREVVEEPDELEMLYKVLVD